MTDPSDPKDPKDSLNLAARRIADFFEQLKPADLARLGEICTDDAL